MTKHRKFALIVGALVAIPLALIAWDYWFRGYLEYRELENKIEALHARDDILAEEKKKWLATLEKQKAAKGRDLTLTEMLATMPAAVARKYAVGFQMGAEPVHFYARIVDQFGTPIEGAVLRYSIAGSHLGGYTPGIVASDVDGRIAITGDGGGITILYIQKPGYYFLSQEQFDYGYDFDITDYFASADRQSPLEKTWYDHVKPDKPYVFRLLKLENVEGVDSGRLTPKLMPDGSWKTYDLRRDPRSGYVNSYAGSDHPGQFRIRAFRGEGQRPDWSFEIEAIDGGVVEAVDDAYMVLAPESGYQPRYVFKAPRSKEGFISDSTRGQRLYFRSNGGREYGSIVITDASFNFREPTVSIALSYRLNERGSRNLNSATFKDHLNP